MCKQPALIGRPLPALGSRPQCPVTLPVPSHIRKRRRIAAAPCVV